MIRGSIAPYSASLSASLFSATFERARFFLMMML